MHEGEGTRNNHTVQAISVPGLFSKQEGTDLEKRNAVQLTAGWSESEKQKQGHQLYSFLTKQRGRSHYEYLVINKSIS